MSHIGTHLFDLCHGRLDTFDLFFKQLRIRIETFDLHFNVYNKQESIIIFDYFSTRAPMEEVQKEQVKEMIQVAGRGRNTFNIKNIDKWDDFKATWKYVKFQLKLNEVNQEEIIKFWQQHLDGLEKQAQQICILVPNQLDKPGVNQDKKSKNTKKKPERVKLSQNVVDIAMRLLQKRKENLSYIYESLFYGNEKQLLIYRACSSIDKYLQKYRLPKEFKQTLDPFIKLSQTLYNLTVKKNIAISTLDLVRTNKLQLQFEELTKQFNEKWLVFKTYFIPILQDFKSKPKTTTIFINTVRGYMYSFLEQVVKSQGLFLVNRYYQTDHDEVRDFVIKKEIYQPLLDTQIVQQPKVKYIYIQPPKVPQRPKDIYDIQLVRIDLAKQCWVWRIHMPRCSSHNQYQGLFFRSPQNEQVAELTVLVSKDTQTVDVDLYAYKLGKITWQIYVWNAVGFTKSSQKIVYYNQLAVPNKTKPLKTYTINLVGESECGVVEQKQQPKMITKSTNKCKDISIYNAAIICDATGNCAGWGEMYYTELQQDQPHRTQLQILDNLKSNLRIENPFLIMSQRYIRKVSCGFGYALMLSSLGSIWSFGFNKYGQLGQGHFKSNFESLQPRQICKFTNGSFIVDICATSRGSSFAIDDQGKLYRWGYNQVDQTHLPIIDRFNTVINYQTGDILYKNATPASISKNAINGAVTKIEAGDEQFFALTIHNELFGWGIVKSLGCGVLKDTKERIIEDIVNPISILNQVESVSNNIMHTVVLTKKKRVLAWGRLNYFSNVLNGFTQVPKDVTQEYASPSPVKQIKAGINYTVVLYQDNSIKIIGSETILQLEKQFSHHPIYDITCSKYQQLFAVLTDE